MTALYIADTLSACPEEELVGRAVAGQLRD